MNAQKNMPDDTEASTLSSNGTDILMPEGSRYAGQAIDSSSRRSIEIEPREDGAELIDSTASHCDADHCVVNYFYHEGEFWRAIIPLDGVDQVFGQSFNFSQPKTRQGGNGAEILFNKHGLPRRKIPILNHLQSRFTFKSDQPVKLYALGSEGVGVPVHLIHDIVYSLETAGPSGVTFNLRDGLRGDLISAHRFLSIQEMVFERIVVENQYVMESPPLPLNESEKRQLLIGSLHRSNQAGISEPYYLYRMCGTNNCTSSPLQIVDNVVKYRLLQRIGSALYRLPLNPRFYLWVRGLDSDPSCRKFVRSEFEDYIRHSATQQRKRDYVRQHIRSRRADKKRRDTESAKTKST